MADGRASVVSTTSAYGTAVTTVAFRHSSFGGGTGVATATVAVRARTARIAIRTENPPRAGAMRRHARSPYRRPFLAVNESNRPGTGSLPRRCFVAISHALAALTNTAFAVSAIAARTRRGILASPAAHQRSAWVSSSRRICVHAPQRSSSFPGRRSKNFLLTRTCPRNVPKRRPPGVRRVIGTRRATGLRPRAMTTCLPPSTCSSSRERCVFASCTVTRIAREGGMTNQTLVHIGGRVDGDRESAASQFAIA